MPRIIYQIDAIRHLEYLLREKMFRSLKADLVFNDVDKAICDAEYVMRETDPDEATSFDNNKIVSELMEDAAAGVKKMADEGSDTARATKGRQEILDGEKQDPAQLTGCHDASTSIKSTIQRASLWLLEKAKGKKGHSPSPSEELRNAAVSLGKMSMEGYAKQHREKEKQRTLEGA
jgi:hypothetical protein